MTRLAVVLVAVAMLAEVSLNRAADKQAPIGAGGIPSNLTYREQLEKGLRARRPVEFEYLRQVVKLVDDGKLPRTLVDTTFVWARKQHRPLQHFQFALKARADDMNLRTPNLNNQAVGTFQ